MLLSALSIVAGSIFLFVTALFLISIPLKRNDIADVAWGPGIVLVALLSVFLSETPTTQQYIILVLVGLWGIRLAVRIYLKNRYKKEDARYALWREEWGPGFYARSYAQVFLLQGFLMIVVGYGAIHAHVYAANASITTLTIIGIALWCIGYFFEVVADYQLDSYLSNPNKKGTVMRTGLWKYSRHPNYFGEITMWWGIWLIVLPLPLGILAIMSPLMITFLITKVSGIPMLEAHLSKNPEYREYASKTSALIPLPTKSNV